MPRPRRSSPLVAARMAEVLSSETEYGNPASSSHDYGDVAAALVESARAQVAAAVGAASREIVFTSGATEANNLAIFGVAQYYRERGRHIVTARTEHKAVLDPCRELERRGWEISYLDSRSRRTVGSRAKLPPRCARTRCWCRSCTSTTRSAWCRTSRRSARSVPGTAEPGCMSMRHKASENARCILRASVPTSCRSRRTRYTDRRAWAPW